MEAAHGFVSLPTPTLPLGTFQRPDFRQSWLFLPTASY